MQLNYVKQAFNKAAKHYDRSCALQLKTGELLIDLLKFHAVNSENILDAGCGTGIVTQQLASTFHYKTFYAIDMAAQLLKLAQQKLAHLNIQVELSNYNAIDHIHVNFDLIFANLSLHWSKNLNDTIATLHNKLKKNGILAFTIPLTGTFRELEPHFSVNKFHTLASIKDFALKTKSSLLYAQEHHLIFEFETMLAALKSIKAAGTNYVAEENKNKTPVSKLKQFIESHQHTFELNYSIGCFLIKK